MASMSLEFILCESSETSAPRTRTQLRKKTKKDPSPATRTNRGSTLSAEASDHNAVARRIDKANVRDKALKGPDRQQHVRRLQNLRQRRYRERKKSTASALQTTAVELQQENATLETEILQHFKSQL